MLTLNDLGCMLDISHGIPYTWNFLRHVYFMVEHETGIFTVEISRMKVIQNFSHFSRLVQGYVRKMYATNLSEIDKTLYQIVYDSRGNPRPTCGKSWESVLSPVGQSKWTNNTDYHELLKNNVQMHEMTCSTWPTVVSYSLKPTA